MTLSEWTKFWSLRSTTLTVALTFVLTVGFGTLVCWGTSANFDDLTPADRAAFDATSISLVGLFLGQLAIAALGALVISQEYATGGIRPTLIAVPQRLKVLSAKALVVAAIALTLGLAASFVSFHIGQLFFATRDVEAHLDDPAVLRAVAGGGLYLAASAMFGLAVATVLRHTAGAVTTAIAALLVVPPLTHLLPGDWGETVARYFTSNAGQRITDVRHDPAGLMPWPGYLVFTLEWLVILVIGAASMRRRDV